MSASDSVHPLKTFLHLQLASDNAAVLNLPYVIRFLSAQHLQPSPHRAALPLFSVRVSTHTLFSWVSQCEETSTFADSKSCHATSHTYFLGCTRYTGVPEANPIPECAQV